MNKRVLNKLVKQAGNFLRDAGCVEIVIAASALPGASATFTRGGDQFRLMVAARICESTAFSMCREEVPCDPT